MLPPPANPPSATVLTAPTTLPAETNVPVVTFTPLPPPSPTPIPPTLPPPTNPPPAFTIIEFTSSVHINQNAILRIQTTPGTACNLIYVTPSQNRSDAQGLGPTTADASGICVWTWVIGPSTSPGTGTLYLTVGQTQQTLQIGRSEERRVGKECRSRWS